MKRFLLDTSARMHNVMVRKAYQPDLKGGTGNVRQQPPPKREMIGIMQSSGTYKQPINEKGQVATKMMTKTKPIVKKKQVRVPNKKRYNNNML